jgi:hypothetical protein
VAATVTIASTQFAPTSWKWQATITPQSQFTEMPLLGAQAFRGPERNGHVSRVWHTSERSQLCLAGAYQSVNERYGKPAQSVLLTSLTRASFSPEKR